MTQEKRTKIAAAVTVTTVLLIVVLVCVIIYQIIAIAVMSVRRNKMKDELNYYLELKDEGDEEMERLQSERLLEYKAYQYGYGYGFKA